MSNNSYYKDKFENLEMYQRLIQYWSILFDRRESMNILDNMNFNVHLFPEIFTMDEISALHQIEPGYTSPDGYTEMNALIRRLELARLLQNAPQRAEISHRLVEQAGIGCGNGCTNVMNGVINSILKLKQVEKGLEHPEVILILPNYTVYAAQLSNLNDKATSKYVYTQRENNYLPTSCEIRNAITPSTVAVIITYPNNPAQSTYEGENVRELQQIVELCQTNEIFLVVDNIYQDLIFPKSRGFTEIFNLTDKLDYVIKVYGCSKDTPFYSGFRTGYWFGDPRIDEKYKYFISSMENSMNTHSLVYFALNLYFKYKLLTGEEPALEDMKLFDQGLFGWSQNVDEHLLFKKMQELKLFAKYQSRIQLSDNIQADALRRVTEYVKGSKVFVDYTNQQIGNVFFIKVNPEYRFDNDDEFFKKLFYEVNCGILPGNVFGILQRPDEIWFRITLIHDRVDNIIRYLSKIEDVFAHSAII
ncbi:aminotransferase class I/II-fold pyridoxal phosphate-dependent enzyme [Paenibacillus alvei]|uniref:aminotransferase class I/II-fold pyridoxal phosphate-dependent enzyme n=1 Tax=Paenibacillus alvei TaxID=44250 RepID=UPI0003864564|nr:aminotransferase class I/II-fold pyridoxal phosphate-dependent enzyme [Paenibacillus alvei]EPY11135.1 aspartate aminotransferase [Paenibacillus alvei A6-6i-x]